MSKRYQQVPTQENLDELPSWESLRKQARHLEYQIDSRLISYSQSSANSTNTSIQQELTTLLQTLTKVSNDMGIHAQNNPQYSHLHSRHVSNLYEYNKEFKKTKANIQSQRDHLELLAGDYSRSSHLSELTRMEQSHNDVDEILQHAMDSRDDLERQQNDLRNSTGRLNRASAIFPQLRTVLNQIQTRKGRDTIILGSIIGILTCILLWYAFR
ncbi:hypothetical protein BC833DRAFT_587594 [Globomyces pollinis-pini]|nr:hypothetical protein BC833DRAFT_587594 [Globomyces pollinis-pini]KAJ2994276.1 Golgi SNAP receptor complex member 1 [Globomyces sp. JEL0801]